MAKLPFSVEFCKLLYTSNLQLVRAPTRGPHSGLKSPIWVICSNWVPGGSILNKIEVFRKEPKIEIFFLALI